MPDLKAVNSFKNDLCSICHVPGIIISTKPMVMKNKKKKKKKGKNSCLGASYIPMMDGE